MRNSDMWWFYTRVWAPVNALGILGWLLGQVPS